MQPRVLLLQEAGKSAREREELIADAGFKVLVADSQNLYWTKYIESGTWEYILFDQTCFDMIFVEMASELGCSPGKNTELILITDKEIAEENLPTPLRSALQIKNTEGLLTVLKQGYSSLMKSFDRLMKNYP